jgi:hypothetical protein
VRSAVVRGVEVLPARRKGRERDGELRGSRRRAGSAARQQRGSVKDVRVDLHARQPADHPEASVPRNYPPPTIFQQSLGWLDENGTRIRYNNINHNEPDVPRPGIRGR